MRSLRLLCVKNTHILGLLLTIFASHAMDKQPKNISPKYTKEIKIRFWRNLFKDIFYKSSGIIVPPVKLLTFSNLTSHIIEATKQLQKESK